MQRQRYHVAIVFASKRDDSLVVVFPLGGSSETEVRQGQEG